MLIIEHGSILGVFCIEARISVSVSMPQRDRSASVTVMVPNSGSSAPTYTSNMMAKSRYLI